MDPFGAAAGAGGAYVPPPPPTLEKVRTMAEEMETVAVIGLGPHGPTVARGRWNAGENVNLRRWPI